MTESLTPNPLPQRGEHPEGHKGGSVPLRGLLHYDLAIVGGGPVGAALATALDGSGLSVAVLEARARLEARDPRAIALSQGARLILERLGAWDRLDGKATPIETIHVSQRGGFGRAELAANELGVPALGYVAEYGDLYGALVAQLMATGTQVLTGAQVQAVKATGAYGVVEYQQEGEARLLTANLVVLAEGGRGLPASRQEVKDYGQTAVVCTVVTEQPHAHRAYERFTPEGPMALLPLHAGYALVWTVPQAKAQRILGLDDAAFLAELQAHFGDRQGRFATASARAAFPLRLVTAKPEQGPRILRIGNAAQTLHPVAGQGFNLGLRDAWKLAQLAWDTPKEQLGGAGFAAAYQASRRTDVRAGLAMTDLLVELFSNDHALLRLGRGAGLALLDLVPLLKTVFARKMMFGGQAW